MQGLLLRRPSKEALGGDEGNEVRDFYRTLARRSGTSARATSGALQESRLGSHSQGKSVAIQHGLKCLSATPITKVSHAPATHLHVPVSFSILTPSKSPKHSNDRIPEGSSTEGSTAEEFELRIPDLGDDPGLDLPPIPRPLLAVLRHLHSSVFADEEAVRTALQCDPSLEEDVLRRINTQLAHPKDSLKQAIQMLGPTTVAGIVLQLSMRELHALRNGPAGSCLVRLVQHSEGTAILARHLSERFQGKANDEGPRDRSSQASSVGTSPFAMGFVHDLGKLTLMFNFPKRAASFYGNERTEGDRGKSDELFLEECVFGCNHAEAGAWTASQVGLPAPLVAAAGLHHDDPDVDGGQDPKTELPEGITAQDLRAVRAATLMTKAIGPDFSGLHPVSNSVSWEECAEAPAWINWRDGPAGPGTSGPSPKTVVKELLESGNLVLYSKFFLGRTNLPFST